MKLKDHKNKLIAGVIGAVVIGIGVTATVLTGGMAAIGFLAVGTVAAGAMGVVADVQDYKGKQFREKKPYELGFIKPLKSLWKKRVSGDTDAPEPSKSRYDGSDQKQESELPVFSASDMDYDQVSKEVEELFNKSQLKNLETHKPSSYDFDSKSSSYTPMQAKKKEKSKEPQPKKKNIIARAFSKNKSL